MVEKGGKERVAPVLNACKDEITAIINKAAEATQPIFKDYDSHIDKHHFRAQYCSALLKQLEMEYAQGKPWFGGDLNPKDYIHLMDLDAKCGATYRGHPTQVVAAVSGAMGIIVWRSFSSTTITHRNVP